MRILAIGAHPDDCELGAGATLAKHAMLGNEVTLLILGTGVTSRLVGGSASVAELKHQATEAAGILGVSVQTLSFPDQRFDTVEVLDITRAIEEVVAKIQPQWVYTHSGSDLNLDHRITHQAVLTACRPVPDGCVKALYAFEVPSSTEWGTVFHPEHFVDVSGEPIRKKQAALACYAGEMRQFPHPRSSGGVHALASWRGAIVGVEAAEAFEVLREIR